MSGLATLAKRSKFIHSCYKFARDNRSIPAVKWRRPTELFAVFRVLPNTMLPPGRLFDAYEAIRTVNAEGLEGDVVECGVWNGGCVGLMALAHGRTGDGLARTFHLFDSFEGLPPPSPEDDDVLDEFKSKHPDMDLNVGDGNNLVAVGACAGDQQPSVERFLTKTLNLDRDMLRFHVGWFQDTVPAAKDVGDIAVLRLDGDWYDSTRVCIEGFYDRVVPGGFVIIDDYGTFSGCRKAIDDFLASRQVTVEITRTDSDCVYFRKP